jgi:hypothetical protein
MRIRGIRYALSSCVAAALLAGCGGSQSPIGAPGAMPLSQTSAIATHAGRGGSWMLPEAKGRDLLYVSSDLYASGKSDVFVFSYPEGKLIGTLTGFSEPAGECVDRKGNVFITDTEASGAGYVYEYHHGGTKPIATLSDPLGYPLGCSIDRVTGNLAVVSISGVAIYKDAKGAPVTFTDSGFSHMRYGGYDNKGNLFVDGASAGSTYFGFAELPAGSSNFTNISITDITQGDAGSVQWDGTYITVESVIRRAYIYRLSVSGSNASIAGTTTLTSNRDRYNGGEFWILGQKVIGPDNAGETIAFWKYPTGGRGTKTIKSPAREAWGVTVSLASKR